MKWALRAGARKCRPIQCRGHHTRRNAVAKPAKNTICLWYDGDAEEAAQFYAKTFPDSSVGASHRAPGDFPSGKKGDVITVEFTVMGIPCIGLNGGPEFKHTEAFSFQVATTDQAETDRYWNAIVGNGGEESACGWCKRLPKNRVNKILTHYFMTSSRMFKHTTAAAMLVQASIETLERSYRTRIRRRPLIQLIVRSTTHRTRPR